MKTIVAVFLILTVYSVGYSWQNEVGVCTTSGLQLFPLIVPDQTSENGAIIAWIDQRNSHYEVYAKRIRGSDGQTGTGWDPSGNVASLPPPQYTPHGHRLNPAVTYGDAGEIIIAWVNHHLLKAGNEEYKPGIYCQKMKDGTIQWPKPNPQQGGIPITTTSTNPVSLCSDGAGGCIIGWMEPPTSSNPNYYVKATRLDADGSPNTDWLPNPVTIASGTDRLGKPQVAVVDTFVVVVFDSLSISYNKNDSTYYSHSYLRAVRLNGSDGSNKKYALISQNNISTHHNNFYWDYLDYPISACRDTFLYICEWTGRRTINTDATYYHADVLQIKLHKLNVATTNMDTLWTSDIATSSYSTGHDSMWINFTPIENFPLRAPVITARSDGGAAVIYTTAANFDYSTDDQRQWNLVVKYANAAGTITMPYTSSSDTVHTPDVIPVGGDTCIIAYSSYGSGSTVKTLMVKSTGVVWNESDGSSTYNCSPRLIKSDSSHFIVVWASGTSQFDSDWDLYAQRRTISTGQP